MLHLKDSSVLVTGLKQEMYYALGVADQAYADEGLECVVTAALDGKHNAGSLHSMGAAVDLRNSNCTEEQRSRILAKLERLEKYGFDVVSEVPGSTAATSGEHFHLEWQPKVGESFWHTAQSLPPSP